MPINPRDKGAGGEREIAKELEVAARVVILRLKLPQPTVAIFQRNQNQSAVGGSDLNNPYGLSIEVKRQETLAIPEWWRQCVASAEQSNEFPVLVYRQNGKKWRAYTYGWIPLLNNQFYRAEVEMDWKTFLSWFDKWVEGKLNS